MSSPRIDDDRVRRVANLARLALTNEEIGTLRSELDAILAHVATLEKLDTSAVEPTFLPFAEACPLRPDEPVRSLSRREVLAQAPRANEEGFIVPRVLDGDK